MRIRIAVLSFCQKALISKAFWLLSASVATRQSNSRLAIQSAKALGSSRLSFDLRAIVSLLIQENFLNWNPLGENVPRQSHSTEQRRIEGTHLCLAALVFRRGDLLIWQQLIEAVIVAQEGEGYHIVPLFHILPLIFPHVHRDGAIVVDIVLHEHLLVVFQLLNGGHIAFDAAGGRLHREFQYLGGGILGILAYLGQYRITRLLADAAQRISGDDAYPADIVGRMGVVHSAGHGGQQRSTAGLELRPDRLVVFAPLQAANRQIEYFACQNTKKD